MNDLKGRYILIHDECGIDRFSVTTKDISAVDVATMLLTACVNTLEGLGLSESQVRCAIANALDAFYTRESEA